jgi:cytochrome subunit of sulfide dehydrogenase
MPKRIFIRYRAIFKMETYSMRALLLKPAFLFAMCLGISPLTTVLAQNADATNLYHRGLASTCANCHGTDGKGVPNGGMPLINHLTSEQMLAQLKAFKSGAREGTIMPQLAKGYSDEQLEIIAKQLGKKP